MHDMLAMNNSLIQNNHRNSPYTNIPDISVNNNQQENTKKDRAPIGVNPAYNFNRSQKRNNHNNSPKVLSRNIVRKEQPIALNQLKEICKGRKEKIEMKEIVENNNIEKSNSETSKSSEKIVVTIDEKFDGDLLSMLQ